ncbi:hypothetical protein XH80_20175 [Bradyrhizobium sp. CCBAU 45384]|nr:hypothetical protein [Bradyrhizobium sp. CCBAU 45384]
MPCPSPDGPVRTMWPSNGFPPTLTNFAIGFQDYAGSHNDLRNAIDLLIDHNRPFDVRTNQDLFETYIAPQVSAVVVETSERLQALMDAENELDRAEAAG